MERHFFGQFGLEAELCDCDPPVMDKETKASLYMQHNVLHATFLTLSCQSLAYPGSQETVECGRDPADNRYAPERESTKIRQMEGRTSYIR